MIPKPHERRRSTVVFHDGESIATVIERSAIRCEAIARYHAIDLNVPIVESLETAGFLYGVP